MTVQYSQLVLTGGPGVFFKLLLKWRGCVFKLIYIDVIAFLSLYAAVSCIYRFALSTESQRLFERLILFINSFQTMIPVAFILGFYIDLIFNRFWTTFMTVPWIVKFSMALVTHLPGTDDKSRLIRRTCVRYLMASQIITATRLHLVAKKRFPSFDFFVAAGILTEDEVKIIVETQPAHVQPFVPIVWVTSLITLAEKDRLINNRHALIFILDEVNNFRQGLLDLFMLDYVCIPLVYTQVVTLSVYSYFVASLIGRQYIVDSSPFSSQTTGKDLYFPFFTLLEFIIYVGWLKVAETLVNPMGEDDEDIDINEIIDFNWKAGWCIVDGMRTSPPAVVRDIHWHQSIIELPHTEESKRLNIQPFRGSVFDINVHGLPEGIGSMASINAAGRSQDFTSLRVPGRQSVSSNASRHLPGHDWRKSSEIMENANEPPDARLTTRGGVGDVGEHKESETPGQSHAPTGKGISETIREEDEDEADEEPTNGESNLKSENKDKNNESAH